MGSTGHSSAYSIKAEHKTKQLSDDALNARQSYSLSFIILKLLSEGDQAVNKRTCCQRAPHFANITLTCEVKLIVK